MIYPVTSITFAIAWQYACDNHAHFGYIRVIVALADLVN
jgi:hypothetical protein